jgi:hypothetical protein
MSGRHEPPTKRSFYFSVATSTVRFAIIVALVFGGVVLIGKAFPEVSGGAPSVGVLSPTPSESSSPKPSKTPKDTPSPQVQGVRIAVYNGTSVTGLAADTATKLSDTYQYVADPQNVADAPSAVAQTTLYYRSAQDQIEAQYIADVFFKGLDVKIAQLDATSDVPKSVQVAIYLGTDYAATKH